MNTSLENNDVYDYLLSKKICHFDNIFLIARKK